MDKNKVLKSPLRSHNRLRTIREERGIKAFAIADAMGVALQFYYNLEKGLRRLNEDHLRAAAKFLDVSCDEILDLESRPTTPKNLSYLDAADPGTALNTALKIAQEENWTHDDLREAIRTMADVWGFFPAAAIHPGMAAAY